MDIDTEIDWKAYMQQVETVSEVSRSMVPFASRAVYLFFFQIRSGVFGENIEFILVGLGMIQGETDYREIMGQTGPLVYPAGFVHVFRVMYWTTGGGSIAQAQVLLAEIFDLLDFEHFIECFVLQLSSFTLS